MSSSLTLSSHSQSSFLVPRSLPALMQRLLCLLLVSSLLLARLGALGVGTAFVLFILMAAGPDTERVLKPVRMWVSCR